MFWYVYKVHFMYKVHFIYKNVLSKHDYIDHLAIYLNNFFTEKITSAFIREQDSQCFAILVDLRFYVNLVLLCYYPLTFIELLTIS